MSLSDICLESNVSYVNRVDDTDHYNFCIVPNSGYDAILFASIAILVTCIVSARLSAVWVLIIGALCEALSYNINLARFGNSVAIWLGMQPAEVFFYIFLPPLLLDSAVRIDFFIFRKVMGLALVLAFVMVAASTFLAIPVMLYGLGLQDHGWSWPHAALFAAMVASTDAVAVSSNLKSGGAPEQLAALLEGESLFNDASGLVLFDIFLKKLAEANAVITAMSASAAASVAASGGYLAGDKGDGSSSGGGPFIPWQPTQLASSSVLHELYHVLKDFTWLVCGGCMTGLLFGYATIWLLKFVQWRGAKPVTEVAISLALAYLCFYVANAPMATSGVIAVVVYGLMGSWSMKWELSTRAKRDGSFEHFWDVISFAMNGLIFFFVGASSVNFFSRMGAELTEDGVLPLVKDIAIRLPIIYLAFTLLRGLLIGILSPLVGYFSSEVYLPWQGVVFATVGGLRGAVSLILAQSVLALHTGTAYEGGEEGASKKTNQRVTAQMVMWTAGFVLMTLLINAPLLTPLMSVLGLNQTTAVKQQVRRKAKQALLKYSAAAVADLRNDADEMLRGVDWTAVENFVDLSDALDKVFPDHQRGNCPWTPKAPSRPTTARSDAGGGPSTDGGSLSAQPTGADSFPAVSSWSEFGAMAEEQARAIQDLGGMSGTTDGGSGGGGVGGDVESGTAPSGAWPPLPGRATVLHDGAGNVRGLSGEAAVAAGGGEDGAIDRVGDGGGDEVPPTSVAGAARGLPAGPPPLLVPSGAASAVSATSALSSDLPREAAGHPSASQLQAGHVASPGPSPMASHEKGRRHAGAAVMAGGKGPQTAALSPHAVVSPNMSVATSAGGGTERGAQRSGGGAGVVGGGPSGGHHRSSATASSTGAAGGRRLGSLDSDGGRTSLEGPLQEAYSPMSRSSHDQEQLAKRLVHERSVMLDARFEALQREQQDAYTFAVAGRSQPTHEPAPRSRFANEHPHHQALDVLSEEDVVTHSSELPASAAGGRPLLSVRPPRTDNASFASAPSTTASASELSPSVPSAKALLRLTSGRLKSAESSRDALFGRIDERHMPPSSVLESELEGEGDVAQSLAGQQQQQQQRRDSGSNGLPPVGGNGGPWDSGSGGQRDKQRDTAAWLAVSSHPLPMEASLSGGSFLESMRGGDSFVTAGGGAAAVDSAAAGVQGGLGREDSYLESKREQERIQAVLDKAEAEYAMRHLLPQTQPHQPQQLPPSPPLPQPPQSPQQHVAPVHPAGERIGLPPRAKRTSISQLSGALPSPSAAASAAGAAAADMSLAALAKAPVTASGTGGFGVHHGATACGARSRPVNPPSPLGASVIPLSSVKDLAAVQARRTATSSTDGGPGTARRSSGGWDSGVGRGGSGVVDEELLAPGEAVAEYAGVCVLSGAMPLFGQPGTGMIRSASMCRRDSADGLSGLNVATMGSHDGGRTEGAGGGGGGIGGGIHSAAAAGGAGAAGPRKRVSNPASWTPFSMAPEMTSDGFVESLGRSADSFPDRLASAPVLPAPLSPTSPQPIPSPGGRHRVESDPAIKSNAGVGEGSGQDDSLLEDELAVGSLGRKGRTRRARFDPFLVVGHENGSPSVGSAGGAHNELFSFHPLKATNLPVHTIRPGLIQRQNSSGSGNRWYGVRRPAEARGTEGRAADEGRTGGGKEAMPSLARTSIRTISEPSLARTSRREAGELMSDALNVRFLDPADHSDAGGEEGSERGALMAKMEGEALAELRVRLLSGFKRYFHAKHVEGLLSGRGMRVLDFCCDTCLDKPDHSLDLWSVVLGEVEGRGVHWQARLHFWLRMRIRQIKRSRLWGTTLLTRPLMWWANALGAVLSKAMMTSLEVSLELWLALTSSPQAQWVEYSGAVGAALQKELQEQADKVWRFIIDREIEAPDRFHAIQGHRATMAVLRQQHAFVEQLFESGALDQAEFEAFSEPIERRMWLLEMQGPKWHHPSLAQVLQNVPFLRSASPMAFEWLIAHGELASYHRGQRIVPTDNPEEDIGIFIVVSGMVKITIEPAPGEATGEALYLGMGGVGGVLETLIGWGGRLPGLSIRTATAEGNVLGRGPILFQLSHDAVRAIRDKARHRDAAFADMELGMFRLAGQIILDHQRPSTIANIVSLLVAATTSAEEHLGPGQRSHLRNMIERTAEQNTERSSTMPFTARGRSVLLDTMLDSHHDRGREGGGGGGAHSDATSETGSTSHGGSASTLGSDLFAGPNEQLTRRSLDRAIEIFEAVKRSVQGSHLVILAPRQSLTQRSTLILVGGAIIQKRSVRWEQHHGGGGQDGGGGGDGGAAAGSASFRRNGSAATATSSFRRDGGGSHDGQALLGLDTDADPGLQAVGGGRFAPMPVYRPPATLLWLPAYFEYGIARYFRHTGTVEFVAGQHGATLLVCDVDAHAEAVDTITADRSF